MTLKGSRPTNSREDTNEIVTAKLPLAENKQRDGKVSVTSLRSGFTNAGEL